MAKLAAHGRREWVRAERDGVRRAYMSDGNVLWNIQSGDGSWSGWKKFAKWNVARPLPEIRAALVRDGWTVLPPRGV